MPALMFREIVSTYLIAAESIVFALFHSTYIDCVKSMYSEQWGEKLHTHHSTTNMTTIGLYVSLLDMLAQMNDTERTLCFSAVLRDRTQAAPSH